ncbi:retrovirus-related pol polyprotein from transposon TNT 1-94, partial [Tanacetum coccineum]
CSKHMTGDRSWLNNFMKKFIGTVRFGNDHFGAIMRYGDYVIGDSVISMVYYVEGLRHNLFSVGQFCDSDLEVAFRKMALLNDMFDEYFKTSTVDRLVPPTLIAQDPVNPTGLSVFIPIDQEAPSGSHSPSSSDHQSSLVHQGVAAEHLFEVNPFAVADPEPFVNVAPDHNSKASSSGNPSRPVSTQKQLATNALWCFYNLVLSKVEPKNIKSAVTEDCWFQAMQDKIHEFDRLDVWELVPPPDCAMIIALKWIYKVKLDEYGDVLKNKAHLVAKGYRQEEGLDFEESLPRSIFLDLKLSEYFLPKLPAKI